MTLTLDPRDRAPQAKKHVGSYYPIDAMKRLAKPPKPSVIERLGTWYLNLHWSVLLLWVVVVLMALSFAIVVNL